MTGIQLRPVGIFWDIENCPVPKNKSSSDVIAHIRNFFVINRLNHREYEFIISCDVTRLRKDIPEDINKAGGVTLAHVNGSSKNAADEKLRENMKKFVDTHASSSVSPVLILVSGDIDFVNDLRGYQTRLGCTIVLIHAETCSSQFKVGWNEIYCFTSFCAAVKDKAGSDAVANSKKAKQKQTNQKDQDQPNRQNSKNPSGQSQSKNQGGPEVRSNDPKPLPGQTVQGNQKPKGKNKTNNSHQFPAPSPDIPQQYDGGDHFSQQFSFPPPAPPQQHHGGNQFGQGPFTNTQRFPPPQQNQGNQFGQGYRNKQHNNTNGMNASNNGNQRHDQKSNNAKDGTDKSRPQKHILMVGGLPGKMDFKILKEHLQFQADMVHGKVTYVKNGQAFITFNHKSNADRAVELFNGKQVYGKTLNVSFTKSIPFEDPSKPKPGPDGFVMIDKPVAGGSKKSRKKDGNNGTNGQEKNIGSTSSIGDLSKDPVLSGLGSIIGGIVANRIAAANPGNKSPESCPIQ